MQIELLGSGSWAEYTVEGSVVRFGELEIDCAALQSGAAVAVDVCRDKAGNLVLGITEGASYVASLVIPPTEHVEQTQEQIEQLMVQVGETVEPTSGGWLSKLLQYSQKIKFLSFLVGSPAEKPVLDNNSGFQVSVLVALPVNMNKVRLSLWPVDTATLK